jgi:hypothetical protein
MEGDRKVPVQQMMGGPQASTPGTLKTSGGIKEAPGIKPGVVGRKLVEHEGHRRTCQSEEAHSDEQLFLGGGEPVHCENAVT